jgi:anti-sigma B factor antagonist
MTTDPSVQTAATSQKGQPAPASSPGSVSLAPADGPEVTAVLVDLPAEIDISNDCRVRDLLADALNRRPAVVIADGTDTTFCGSSSVSMLLEAHHRATAAGAQLRLVATGAEVHRILEVTGAADELCVFPSLEAAVQAGGTHPASPVAEWPTDAA